MIIVIIVYCLLELEEISPTDSQKLLVGMRNVVSSQHGVGPGGEGFVVSFLCKLFNHQHHQIKAGRGGVTWIQSRSAGVKYRLSGGEARGEKWKMICKLNTKVR